MNAYRSILTKATAPITSDSFEGLDRVILDESREPGSLVPFWEANIPYAPRQIFNLLQAHFKEPVFTIFTMFSPRYMEIKISKDKAQDELFTGEFGFDSSNPVFETGRIQVIETEQGKGYGTSLLQAWVESAVAFDRTKITMTASDDGAYAWSAAGVELNMEILSVATEWHQRLQHRLAARLHAAKSFIKHESFERARSLIQFLNKRDNCDLARMTDLISVPESRDEFSIFHSPMGLAILDYHGRHSGDKNPVEETLIECESISKIFYNVADQQKPFKLGRFMLSRLDFPGIINLQDAAQLGDMGRHRNRWKTIVPAY